MNYSRPHRKCKQYPRNLNSSTNDLFYREPEIVEDQEDELIKIEEDDEIEEEERNSLILFEDSDVHISDEEEDELDFEEDSTLVHFNFTDKLYKLFLPRFTKNETKDTEIILCPLSCNVTGLITHLIEKTDIIKALKQVTTVYPIYFYPVDPWACKEATKQFKGNLKLGSSTIATNPNANFSQFSEHATKLDMINYDEIKTDTFCFDLERHTFSYTPYVREFACVTLDGRYGFKSPVKFISKIRRDYRKVEKLDEEPYEKYYVQYPNVEHNVLLKEKSDEVNAPSFALAFIGMLQFITDHMKSNKKTNAPILLYQGTNDPSSILFCVLDKNEGIVPDNLRKQLFEMLQNVKPRFVSADAFWKAMNLILRINIPLNLKGISKALFKQYLDTREDKYNIPQIDVTQELGTLISQAGNYTKCVLEVDETYSVFINGPLVNKDNSEVNNYGYTCELPMNTRSGDLAHHTADADCMIMRNAMSALILFLQLIGKLQPYLSVLLENQSSKAAFKAAESSLEYESVHLKNIVGSLMNGLVGKRGSSIEITFKKNYLNLFLVFMECIVKNTSHLQSRHLPMSQNMIALSLNYCMGLRTIKQQLYTSGRRLEGYKIGKPLLNRMFLYNSGLLHLSYSKRNRKQFFLPSPDLIITFWKINQNKIQFSSIKQRMAFIKLLNEAEKEKWDDLETRLHTYYHSQNALLPTPMNPEKLNRKVVFKRRNWPLFTYTQTNSLTRKLHNRFCHLFLTNIEIILNPNTQDQVYGVIRAYRNPVIFGDLHVFSTPARSAGSQYSTVSFCKDCKRFSDHNLDASIAPVLRDFAEYNDSQITYEDWLRHNPSFKIWDYTDPANKPFFAGQKRKYLTEKPVTSIPEILDYPEIKQEPVNLVNSSQNSNYTELPDLEDAAFFDAINISKTQKTQSKQNPKKPTVTTGFIAMNSRNLRTNIMLTSGYSPLNGISMICDYLSKKDVKFDKTPFLSDEDYDIYVSPIAGHVLRHMSLFGSDNEWSKDIVLTLNVFLQWLSILCPLESNNTYSAERCIGTILKLPAVEPEFRKLSYIAVTQIESLLTLRSRYRLHPAWVSTLTNIQQCSENTPLSITLAAYKVIINGTIL